MLASVAAAAPSTLVGADRSPKQSRHRAPPPGPAGMTLLEPAKLAPLDGQGPLYGNPGISPSAFQPPPMERGVTPIDSPLEPPPVEAPIGETWILMPRRTPVEVPLARDAGAPPDAVGPARDAGAPPDAVGPPRDAGAPPDAVGSARDAGAPPDAVGSARDAGAPPYSKAAPPAPGGGDAAAPVAEDPAREEQRRLDQIRRELKTRIMVFQACAYQARRRGVDTLRRLDAKWMIRADGNIQALRIANVTDPQFATCLQRVGNQPLSVKPGVDLTIPTPIVFVR